MQWASANTDTQARDNIGKKLLGPYDPVLVGVQGSPAASPKNAAAIPPPKVRGNARKEFGDRFGANMNGLLSKPDELKNFHNVQRDIQLKPNVDYYNRSPMAEVAAEFVSVQMGSSAACANSPRPTPLLTLPSKKHDTKSTTASSPVQQVEDYSLKPTLLRVPSASPGGGRTHSPCKRTAELMLRFEGKAENAGHWSDWKWSSDKAAENSARLAKTDKVGERDMPMS